MSESKVPYLYRPIAYYGGTVLKCAGIAADSSRKCVAMKAEAAPGSDLTADGYLPGFIELEEYKGDRINAGDYSVFGGVLGG